MTAAGKNGLVIQCVFINTNEKPALPICHVYIYLHCSFCKRYSDAFDNRLQGAQRNKFEYFEKGWGKVKPGCKVTRSDKNFCFVLFVFKFSH